MRHILSLAAVATVGSAMAIGLAVPSGAAQKSSGPQAIVFNGEGNDLDAYTTGNVVKTQKVVTNRNADPDGLDINAQICFFGKGGRTFIAGEDTGQPDIVQGWGIFRLKGNKVGKLSVTQIGKLQPTYQGATDNAENYGCGVLSDGRVVTTDIGNQAAGPEDGQLIVWFPPLDEGFETGADGNVGTVPYCKLDVAIGTAGSIAITGDDEILVASARGASTGVIKYSGPFPTGPTAEDGCDTTDTTGAPMASSVKKEQFINTDHGLLTPNSIVPSLDGGYFVSSVATGIINEYDAGGGFLRTILEPPAGESLGAKPLSTGTPLGLGLGPDGTLYYADIGIVVDGTNIGPGDNTGTLRRIEFGKDGTPEPPETMAEGLAFPDGIGVYVPGS